MAGHTSNVTAIGGDACTKKTTHLLCANFSDHKNILDLRTSALNASFESAPKNVYDQWIAEFGAGLHKAGIFKTPQMRSQLRRKSDLDAPTITALHVRLQSP